MAAQTNAIPLPSVPEVFGIRLPTAAHCLTSVDFDLVPNKPPPGVILYDEEIEEVEEDASDEEEFNKLPAGGIGRQQPGSQIDSNFQEGVGPISAMQSPSDADMASPTGEGSDGGGDDEDGLFAGGDDESEGEDAMESVEVPLNGVNGIKRKLVEEDDYD